MVDPAIWCGAPSAFGIRVYKFLAQCTTAYGGVNHGVTGNICVYGRGSRLVVTFLAQLSLVLLHLKAAGVMGYETTCRPFTAPGGVWIRTVSLSYHPGSARPATQHNHVPYIQGSQ